MMPDTLNNKVQERFNELRKKMKLDFVNQVIEKENKKDIDVNKLTKVFESQPKIENSELSEEVKLIDNTFNFIESLDLPPQLSLAIGLIISGYKTNSLEDLNKSWCEIKDYTSDEWNRRYAKKEGREETNS